MSAANVADVKASPVVLVPALENNSRLVKILADQGYRGAIALLLQIVYGCTLELTRLFWRCEPFAPKQVVQKLGQGFVVEPWRWVVERTFAWLDSARRLGRDYEELPEHHEGFIYVTMIRLMLRKLTQNQRTR